ncbi:hypothetical protein GCM10010123_08440 [Pilimelia anulata]|uniref:Activator of Hsp90 ATPase homologue 1/2-like C-terminal domain-containing protein n=1 Tax=Pilimelia anulata TaxID=53371 RepID=A0A8J3B7B5_9ACTN|nr:SRPBCC domain-containing protein [Pilimelia anulata]GGJ80873.1 hypothetical protein GCM10010123_08440 [Pilimelia anulata]
MTPRHTPTALAPLLHTVLLPVPPARAFRLFTAEYGGWWPLRTHSVGGERSGGVHFGGAAGEQIIEQLADAEPVTWGTLTVWDPPYRVAFTWHPGRPEPEATRIEVTFIGVDDRTEVTLRHTGWVNRPDGDAARERYARDWPAVLDAYAASTD